MLKFEPKKWRVQSLKHTNFSLFSIQTFLTQSNKVQIQCKPSLDSNRKPILLAPITGLILTILVKITITIIIHQNNKKNVNMSHRSWNKSTQIPIWPHESGHTDSLFCLLWLLANIFFPSFRSPLSVCTVQGIAFQKVAFYHASKG